MMVAFRLFIRILGHWMCTSVADAIKILEDAFKVA